MAFTIYLTGQNNFGNRGCEALVRSAVATLNDRLGDVRFLVPSNDIPRDSAQWPEAASSGVRFVPAPQVPTSYKWWGRFCRICPPLKRLRWPSLRNLPSLEEYLIQADAVISIGGDNYSLDYGAVSLFFFVGIAERSVELKKPVGLWGASVGPFSSEPAIERLMAGHLNRLSFISVRESHSENYLRSIGVTKNVASVVDAAFALTKQEFDVEGIWPRGGSKGVLGFNVSPLIEDAYQRAGKSGSVRTASIEFIRQVIDETQYAIVLVPHVAPLDDGEFNNDNRYLQSIAERFSNEPDRLQILPRGLNACQLKYAISKCRFFIGARTHATIAALSSEVPTISIAYSIKARGINRDLFGDEDVVLPTLNVSAATLMDSLRLLEANEKRIHSVLATKIPEWKQRALLSAIKLEQCLNRLST